MTIVGQIGEHKRVVKDRYRDNFCNDCGARWDEDDTAPVECNPPGHATMPQAVVDLRPGAINMVDPKTGRSLTQGEAKVYVATLPNFAALDLENMSLVEFAEFKGYKLGPWMKQQLQEIDEAGQRGLPNKG